jgi:hypothetical protein
MTHPATDETTPGAAPAQRTFEVEAVITVTVDSTDLDADTVARAQVDEILQRAWETDRGRHYVNSNWHFELLDGGLVTDITDDETVPGTTSVDEAFEEDMRIIRKFNDDEPAD